MSRLHVELCTFKLWLGLFVLCLRETFTVMADTLEDFVPSKDKGRVRGFSKYPFV